MKNFVRLSKNEMKMVSGGVADDGSGGTGTPGGNNGNPCANGGCSNINHSNNDGSYGTGSCSPSTGGVSCHNYCTDNMYSSSGYYGWC